jgi:hypothetical protein
VIGRKLDAAGRFIRQLELCAHHTEVDYESFETPGATYHTGCCA